MRKVMMLAAMLAMALVAAAPALAQSSAVGGNVQVQNQNCPQTITQYANADQANTGGGIGAGVAQNLGVNQSALNACLQAGNDIQVGGGVVHDFDPGVHPKVHHDYDKDVHPKVHHDYDKDVHPTVHPSGSQSSGGSAAPGGSAAAASGGVLPDTGGASLIALGAGAMLVAGGLLARRVLR